MPSEDFMQGSATVTQASTGAWSGATQATTSSTPFLSTLHGTSADTGHAYESMKKSMKSSEPVKKARRKIVARVINSPEGHRVKLVGANLVELAPFFIRWADQLGKDLRVVITDGDPAYKFYKRPMVASRMGPNGLCLLITGTMTSEIRNDGNKWRVGFDELLALKAPPALDGPEFPSYANIHDEKKVFIGRVENKFIYTMLYMPHRLVEKEAVDLPAGLTMKPDAETQPNLAALEPFLNHVLSRYEKMMETHGDEIRGELTEVSLREFCSDSQRKRERTLTGEIDERTKAMRAKEAEVLDLARKIREGQKDLVLLRSGALNGELAVQAEMMDKLVNDGLYEKFKIRNGRLQGMTAPISIDYNGKVYELGQFVVSIKRDGVLGIEHPTKQHPFHPHISGGGGICLGAIRNDIPKLIGMERYAMVFQVIYEFLGSYNDKDKYNKIEVCTGEQQVPVAAEGQAMPVVNEATPATPQDRGVLPITNLRDFDNARDEAEQDVQNAFRVTANHINVTATMTVAAQETPNEVQEMPQGMNF